MGIYIHLNIFRITFLPSHLFLARRAIFLGSPDASTSTSLVTRDSLNSEEDSFLAITYPFSLLLVSQKIEEERTTPPA